MFSSKYLLFFASVEVSIVSIIFLSLFIHVVWCCSYFLSLCFCIGSVLLVQSFSLCLGVCVFFLFACVCVCVCMSVLSLGLLEWLVVDCRRLFIIVFHVFQVHRSASSHVPLEMRSMSGITGFSRPLGRATLQKSSWLDTCLRE